MTVKITSNKQGSQFARILDLVVKRGFNVRKNVKPSQEFIDSVKQNGIVHPIHVRWETRKKEKLQVIDGERRLVAAGKKGAELGSVPIVHHGFIDDKQATIISLTANDNQKKLTRKELQVGYQRLKNFGLDVADIARVMAVERRLVSEALKVDAKAEKSVKAAAKKSVREGGINPRVASRAAGLPKVEQRKLTPKLKGKPKSEGLAEVRKVEDKLGIKRRGRKAKDEQAPKQQPSKAPKVAKVTGGYAIAKDAAARAQSMEKAIRKKLKFSPTHKVLNAQLMVLECIKGKMQPADLFGWENV